MKNIKPESLKDCLQVNPSKVSKNLVVTKEIAKGIKIPPTPPVKKGK